MDGGRKPKIRALFPLVALAMLGTMWAPVAGTVEAHEVKQQPAAPAQPGALPAGRPGHVPAAASMPAPPRPAAAATYAVWWVIMNNPGFCLGICGLDDLAAADMGADLFHAAGLGPESAEPADRAAPAQPPVRYASEETRAGQEIETCVPGECTPLQTVTFFPPD